MKVIQRVFEEVSRSDSFRHIPLGDIHLGNIACDEALLRKTVKRIADDDRCYWSGLGDYCEWINVRDPRFDAEALAPWISARDLKDVSRVVLERFKEIIAPICHKCLFIAEGNHEHSIRRHTERDVYGEIANFIKKESGMSDADRIGLGYSGWCQLVFRRGENSGTSIININVNHGYVGGRTDGSKINAIVRRMKDYDCDLCLMGHSHNTCVVPTTVIKLDRNGVPYEHHRLGCFTGTFLRSYTTDGEIYPERKGYPPLPVGGVELEYRPYKAKRIRACVEV